jgi:glycerol uptake facilitator-like aquaporin
MLFLVELIGTFLFLSTILSYAGKNPHAAAIIGLALAAAVYWGNGHYNPAVTMMYALGGVSDGAAMRVAGQVAGALAALYWPKLI